MKDETPLVSICCATYNHEPFIRDAIEGFLMQEVDFPIEILINDDASTDRTPEILREYELKNPGLIKVVCQMENKYSSGVKPLAHLLIPRARGKYIAVCEGDDYWTDPQKLARQVSVLNQEYEVALVTHPVVARRGNETWDIYGNTKGVSQIHRKQLSRLELFFHPSTWMFRALVDPLPIEMYRVTNADMFLLSLIGTYGHGIHIENILPSVRRFHPGGIWSEKSKDSKVDMEITTLMGIYSYYKRTGQIEYSRHFWNRLAHAIIVNSTPKSVARGVGRKIVDFVKNPVKN